MSRDDDRFRDLYAELQRTLTTLPDKPQETASSTFHTLWHLAAGRAMSIEAAAEAPLPELDNAGFRKLNALIQQRISGVPLAYITGVQRFMGLDMIAAPDALIPRVETEILTGGALEVLRAMPRENGPLTVLDVCTGSGNVALALAHHDPGTQVFASDLSEKAVELGRRNAQHLNLIDRVEFRSGDLLEPFDEPRFHGQVDLLVGNPPYISSKRVEMMPHEISGFEPRLAFDGGALGVRILQRLIRDAPRFLRPGGWLGFEVGLGQGPAVLKRLQAQTGFEQHRTLADADGVVRAILVSR